MKKLLVYVILLLCMACDSNKYVMGENYIIPGNKNTVTTVVADGTLVDKNNISHTSTKLVSIHKFKYNSHRYIIFDKTILHDPNCECFKEKK